MTVVTSSPVSHPEGYPETCEILHHGGLRLRHDSGDIPFYVRFHSHGRFIPYLTPDAHWRENPSVKLVRVYAKDREEALETIEYHYGLSRDHSMPATIEERVPIHIINGHLHTVVEWPAP